MGNILLTSLLKKYTVYHSCSAWQKWEDISQKNNTSSYKLVRNRANPSLLGQLYVSPKNYQMQNTLQTLQFRYDFIEKQIVGVYGLFLPQLPPQNNLQFCGQLENYAVVVQKIECCFSDLGQITFSDGLNIMKSVIKGAKLIKQKLKILVLYDENMIFFDKQKNCKIWISQYLNENSHPYKGKNVEEFETIQSILTTIELKIQYTQELQNYSKLKANCSFLTFEETLNFINQIKRQQQCCISEMNKSKIFFQQENHKSQKINNMKIRKAQSEKSFAKKSLSIKKTMNKAIQEKGYFSAQKQLSLQNPNSKNREEFYNPNFEGSINLNFRQKKQTSKTVNPFINAATEFTPTNDPTELGLTCQQNRKGQKKNGNLKKQLLRKDEIKEKFSSNRIVESDIRSKPSSTISTHYGSIQITENRQTKLNEWNRNEKIQKINFSNLRTLKVNKIFNCNQCLNEAQNTFNINFVLSSNNFNQYCSDRNNNANCKESKLTKINIKSNQQIPLSNAKISLSTHSSRLKKQLSLQFFYNSNEKLIT